jgi:hypothetical protein
MTTYRKSHIQDLSTQDLSTCHTIVYKIIITGELIPRTRSTSLVVLHGDSLPMTYSAHSPNYIRQHNIRHAHALQGSSRAHTPPHDVSHRSSTRTRTREMASTWRRHEN